jgi:2-succinyl-5-enolpyruvyl-6-hydroxy-3-cyclohexene-1-carboxylate synthase
MEADIYMAEAGHYGSQSTDLVRHYATDLGFEYLKASTKEEFDEVVDRFLIPTLTEKPMLFEIFPDYEDEVENLDYLRHAMPDNRGFSQKLEDMAKSVAKRILNR